MLPNTWKLAMSVKPTAICPDRLSAMAEAGIEELELSAGRLHHFMDEMDYPHRAGEISAVADSCGLPITSVHLPFGPVELLDPASLDADVRRNTVEKQSELLRAAGDAGIGMAVLHPSREPYPDEERAERMKVACEVISCLTDVATEYSITLALENLPRTCLGRTSEEMLYFLDRIPNLRACFDTNHSLREDNAHFIRALGEKIVTLHVSDYDFIDEQHLLPFEGKNDWSAIVSALKEVGYRGRFLYELKDETLYPLLAENRRKILSLS